MRRDPSRAVDSFSLVLALVLPPDLPPIRACLPGDAFYGMGLPHQEVVEAVNARKIRIRLWSDDSDLSRRVEFSYACAHGARHTRLDSAALADLRGLALS